MFPITEGSRTFLLWFGHVSCHIDEYTSIIPFMLHPSYWAALTLLANKYMLRCISKTRLYSVYSHGLYTCDLHRPRLQSINPVLLCHFCHPSEDDGHSQLHRQENNIPLNLIERFAIGGLIACPGDLNWSATTGDGSRFDCRVGNRLL